MQQVELPISNLSNGKWMTFKSPLKHHGKFHQLFKPANSSHIN